jgi:RNAse (barnase) inhibitor barstar
MILLYSKGEPKIPEGILTVNIDGASIKTTDEFYSVLKKELQLPDYFGNNLDALADALTDLSHLEKEEIAIIISNADLLCKEASEEDRMAILETLFYCVDELDLMHEEDALDGSPIIYLYSNSNKQVVDLLDSLSIPYESL